MPNLKSLWLLLAFVAAFLLIGMPFWDIPYSQVSVPNSLVAPGLIGLVALTVILAAFEVASLRRIFVIMSLCLPVVAYARVEVETGRDPMCCARWFRVPSFWRCRMGRNTCFSWKVAVRSNL